MNLVNEGDNATFTSLSGGVSSDIWRVELETGEICIKRALSKLKVAADWWAPVGRNASEVAWIEKATAVVSACAPEILGHDVEAGLFAMPYYGPEDYKLWKNELRDGQVDLHVAQSVGSRLGQIHAATANDNVVAQQFANDEIFYDIRLEPYFVATGRAHPELAEILEHLVSDTAAMKTVLVHGDVSPKNILLGPEGPMFLDAECACYGDPAFDLAFCLNHLLLKCLWTPAAACKFLASYESLVQAYFEHVCWEPRADLERRTTLLLPGLFLARVDGKSPVEYLTEEADKQQVRRVARTLLLNPVPLLSDVGDAWREELNL